MSNKREIFWLNKVKDYLISQNFIPLDKSWIIRMGVLDLLNNYDDIFKILKKQENLNDDLEALHRALLAWRHGMPIEVGESATLYRFLRFASWKLGINKSFVLSGTLKTRKICDNPEIVNYPLVELLKLDNKTSQWASASILLGNQEIIDNPPFKLRVTYEAVRHWQEKRKQGQIWDPRFDQTILNQALAFAKLIKTDQIDFQPEQAEDYCFARAFDLMTKEEGEKRWPSLLSHESNRILEMEESLFEAKQKHVVNSKDHRVIQAVVMHQVFIKQPVSVSFSAAVNKSWPKFWQFIKDLPAILEIR